MNKHQAFAERISNLNIEHPKITKIWGMLDSIRAHQKFGGRKNSPRHLFIIGKSGVGKSQMAKRYAESNPGYVFIDEDGTEIDIKPIVYMEMPDPFTVLEFYQSIVKTLGAPQLAGRSTIGEVKRQAFTLLDKQKVEMLILDEMDYIQASRYTKNDEAMEAIKHVSNTGQISVICVGTPKTDELRKLNFQYFRRYPLTKLDRFTDCDLEFCNFLNMIEKQIRPPIFTGLGNLDTGLPQLLHAMSKGLVGILTPAIQEAYRLLGVFEDDFNCFSKARLSVDILLEAYKNIIGDVSEEEFEKMLDRQ